MKLMLKMLILAVCLGAFTSTALAKESRAVQSKRSAVLRSHKSRSGKMTAQIKRSKAALSKAKAAVKRAQAALAAARKAMKGAMARHRSNATTYRMTVKECKKAMRQTFGLGTTRAERRRWLGRCEKVYGAARSLSR